MKYKQILTEKVTELNCKMNIFGFLFEHLTGPYKVSWLDLIGMQEFHNVYRKTYYRPLNEIWDPLKIWCIISLIVRLI